MPYCLVADISAQIVINHRIKSVFPAVTIIGEEDSTVISTEMYERIKNVLSEYPEMGIDLSSKEALEAILRTSDLADGCDRYWTVDPIDGTKGFIRGDQYAVCIALLDRLSESPLIAALGCPNLPIKNASDAEKGLLLLSIANKGNFACAMGSEIGDLEPLGRVQATADLSTAIFAGAFVSSHTNPLEIDAIKSNFSNSVPIVHMDSQCKYGLLALNRAQVYYRRHVSRNPAARKDWKCDYVEAIWDNAPGYLFVKEAGGRVTDFANNDLKFPPCKNFQVVGGILASTLTPDAHKQVIDVVQKRNPFVEKQ